MRHWIKYLVLLLLLVDCNNNRLNKGLSNISNSLDSLKADSSNINKNTNYQKNDTLYCDCKNGKMLFEIQSDTSIVIIRRTSNNRDTIIKRIGSFSDDLEVFIERDSKLFKFGKDYFFKAQITERGTGYFNWDALYRIDKDNCGLDSVIIQYSEYAYKKYLKKKEGIWKGEGRVYQDDMINGYFYIWNDTDANCCPSVGEVSVSYKIKTINDKLIMQPDTNTFKFKKY